jgi:hypothetical protein
MRRAPSFKYPVMTASSRFETSPTAKKRAFPDGSQRGGGRYLPAEYPWSMARSAPVIAAAEGEHK